MTTNTTERLADRIAAAKDNAVLQAQIWKHEATAANATIAEIYRLVGSSAGNWNGAQPVRDFLAAHASERAESAPAPAPQGRVVAWRLTENGADNRWYDGQPTDGNKETADSMGYVIQYAYSAPANAGERNVDDIVTSLYRRFKDWSRRGFGADDVTWCEVKADVLALIAAASPTTPAPSEQTLPFRIEQRPMLNAGMLATEDRGIALLIDSEQNERERCVTLWHEVLHLIVAGLGIASHDESASDVAAARLADCCPGILTGDLSAQTAQAGVSDAAPIAPAVVGDVRSRLTASPALPTAGEAAPCACVCGCVSCIEPWEPGCGLGTTAEHAVAVEPTPQAAEAREVVAHGDELVRCYGKTPEGNDGLCVHSAQRIFEMSTAVMIRSCQNSMPLASLYTAPPSPPSAGLRDAVESAHAFIGVMFVANGRMPAEVDSPLGIPIKVGRIYADLAAAIATFADGVAARGE